MTLEVDYDGSQFLIRVPGKNPVAAINDWPGWKRSPSGTYLAPAWPSSIISMTKTVHPLHWSEAAAKKRDKLLADLNGARTMLKLGHTESPVPTERKPKQHQWQAIAAMRFMYHRAMLTDDMGLGKTSTALWAAHDSGVLSILVICPVSVKFNWQREIVETLGTTWATFVIDGSPKKRASQFAEAEAAKDYKAIIINYDLLRHLSKEQSDYLKKFLRSSMLLLDESHYLKNRESDRTEIVTDLSRSARFVIAMTGTPIRNLAEDLFSQVEIVRPGTWSSYRDFAKRHLVIQAVKFGKRETHKVVGVKNLDALNAVMNTLQIKRKKEDVLDLPPKTYTYPELQLEGDLLKIYKAMKEFAKLKLNSLLQADAAMPLSEQPITIFDPRAKSAVEQAMRCEQIAQGFIGGIPDPVMAKLGADVLKHAEKIPGRPNELMFPHAPKVVWLLETIESVLRQGGAPIVYSRFNAPLLWLGYKLASCGASSELLHGGMSAEQKHRAIDSFQNSRVNVLLAQVKIAEGWNATRCQDVIFWTRDWSPAINTQAEDRAHRMGQRGTVNVQIPIVLKTIESMIHRRLLAKSVDADQALRNVTVEELMEAL